MKKITLIVLMLFTVLSYAQDIELNGTVSAQNNQIKNVANPTEAQDAVTFSVLLEKITALQNQINYLQDTANSNDDDGDGFNELAGDCNDANPLLNPNEYEIRDGIDNNCDGEIDEGYSGFDAVQDADGNTYNFAIYGNQHWTVENAEMVTYRDGTPIPQITDDTEWGALTTGAWCYYNNDPTKHRLYNWYAVMGIHDNDESTPNKEFAPEGWHVPTDAEWTTLEEYLIANGYNYNGTTGNKIAKALASTTGWNSSTGAGVPGNGQSSNNDSGFNAFPEGFRNFDGSFIDEGNLALFWSSAEYNSGNAWSRDLGNNNILGRNTNRTRDGFSVRFVRDASSLSTKDFSNSIIIYPNPVKNILTIDGLVVQDVVIYSVLGKEVLKISNLNTIDVSSLSKGVYFIKVSDGIKASTKKFIKN